MENIQSKYERMTIPVVERKSIGIDKNRLWFGNEVYDSTLRLKCIYVDEYLDGTGQFLNTVWEDFDDNNEYETLFRDLDEEIQKKIYKVIL